MNETPPKVLIVDDNPQNLDVMAALLDEENFKVFFALDGLSALQRAEDGQPDIILLDVMMPEMDGFETCRRLKAQEKTRDIPIIFMTALSSTTDKVQGFEFGAVDYITKPIQPAEVFARITTHLKIRRLQRELQNALDRERALNTLKTRFISVASHELRHPLTAILHATNFLEELGEQLSAEKKAQQFAHIEQSVAHMTDILNDILILSRKETGKIEFHPQMRDVTSFCAAIVHEFHAICDATHTLAFSSPEQPIYASVDAQLLQVILSNLLSNAIKYSPNGGKIAFALLRNADRVLFQITDDGIGISEEDFSHLFETFRRGSNVGDIQGTGLGLSIVKEFVEVHGGSIQVKSAINSGTTVTVTLPLCA